MRRDVDRHILVDCTTERFPDARMCTSYADACLFGAELRKCIGLDLVCADICAATDARADASDRLRQPDFKRGYGFRASRLMIE